jgi:hypothetical protein
MSRGPHAFKESDITRALRAARKAGVQNPIIEVDTKHQRLRIIPRDDVSAATEQNEWDDMLHGKDS